MAAKNSGYKSYIVKLIKDIDSTKGLSGDVGVTLSKVYSILIKEIMKQCRQLSFGSTKKTLSEKEIASGISLYFPKVLAKETKEFAQKAVDIYCENRKTEKSDKDEPKTPVSRNLSANLIFPIPRTEAEMTKQSIISRKTGNSAVYLTASIQYVITRILKQAVVLTTADKKTRVASRHINAAIDEDEQLKTLLSNVVLPGRIIFN